MQFRGRSTLQLAILHSEEIAEFAKKLVRVMRIIGDRSCPRKQVFSVWTFKEAPDLQKRKAKYLLVASFTWTARNQEGEEEVEEIPEVPPDAPEIEDAEAEEEPEQIADEQPEEGPSRIHLRRWKKESR